MRTEDQFSNLVLSYYRHLLQDENLLIDSGKNILTDATCIFENGQFHLLHGFSQTDIVIYKEQKVTFSKNIPDFIKFYNDSEIRRGTLAIPFVVIELKSGELTTDGIRSRDFVADRIRTIFPFAAYYFIAESTKKEEKTLLRQGKSFTNYFISKDEMSKTYLKDIFENYINPHIINLKRQFKTIDK